MPEVPAPRKKPATSKRSHERLKRRFLARAHEDADFWYELAKYHAMFGLRDSDPAVRMTSKIVDKILADQKEVAIPQKAAGAPTIIKFGVALDRGTKTSRERLIAHAEVKVGEEERDDGEEADDGEQQSLDLLSTPAINDPVPREPGER